MKSLLIIFLLMIALIGTIVILGNAIGNGIILALVIIIGILYIFYGIFKDTHKSYKTESYKQIHSTFAMNKYRDKACIIFKKYCDKLPKYDSYGNFCKLYGSIYDETGIFSEGYRKDMAALNEEYTIPGTEPYIQIQEKIKKYHKGKL